MSDLPESWAVASFGELNEFTSSTINPARWPDETFDLYSVPSFPSGSPERLKGSAIGSTKQTVRPSDVLVCKINPRINRVWAVGRKEAYEQIASSEWIGFRSQAVGPQYARHYFSSPRFRELIESDVAGVGGSLTRAQPKKVVAYAVPVAPLAEQSRIADKLDTLLTCINACNHRLDTIPALLKRFRMAVLDAATTGTLTEEWRQPESAPWPIVLLRDHASDFSYGSATKSQKTGRVPVLRMGNIQSGKLDWSNLAFSSDEAEIKKYMLQKGDVLFNRTNSPELVGKTAVYQGERPALYAGYLIRVRCEGDLLPEYLNYCLGSTAGRHYCWTVKSDGVSQSNINAQKLRAFTFALPTLAEQHEIVRRVEALLKLAGRVEACHHAACAQAQRLSPLVLAKAFRGELVQQNPQDEPASALLQRIVEQRSEKAQATRGRSRVQKPEAVEALPVAHPDWSRLPAGAWAAQVPADEHTATAQLTAVLKAWSKPMPQEQARLATLLCLQPRLLTAALPAEHAAQWRRLVGDAATPLPAQVVTLQPAFNTPWRSAISKMRARGDLIESGAGPQGIWALGPDAARVDTVGWPDGRAGWVVHYLKTHGVEAVLPSMASEVQEFVHARAA